MLGDIRASAKSGTGSPQIMRSKIGGAVETAALPFPLDNFGKGFRLQLLVDTLAPENKITTFRLALD